MEEREEQIKQEAIEERKKTKFNLFKIFGTIFLACMLIVLGLIKYYNKDFPLLAIIIVGGVIIVIIIIILFGYKIQKLLHKAKKIEKNEETAPKPISMKEAKELAENILKEPEYADYIDKIIDEGTEEHGKDIKSTIYCLEFTGVYFKGKYFIGINMNYPQKRRRILIEPSIYKITEAKKLLAAYPEELPDTEKIVSEDPLTGRKITTEKTKRHSRHKKNKDKKESDVE